MKEIDARRSLMARPTAMSAKRLTDASTGICDVGACVSPVRKIMRSQQARNQPPQDLQSQFLDLAKDWLRIPSTSIAGETARSRLIATAGGKIDLFSEFLDHRRSGRGMAAA